LERVEVPSLIEVLERILIVDPIVDAYAIAQTSCLVGMEDGINSVLFDGPQTINSVGLRYRMDIRLQIDQKLRGGADLISF